MSRFDIGDSSVRGNPHNNRAARPAAVLLAICCWLSAAGAAWLEKTLYLPDSLCGVTAPSLVVHNSVNNKVYVTGKYGGFTRNGRDCWIVVLDGATNKRIARIAVPSEVGSLEYNATDNKVYAASSVDSSITVIDGSADSVLHRVWLKSKVVGLFWERTMDKLFCSHDRDSSVTVLDAAVDTVLARIHTTCRPNVFQPASEFHKLYCGESNSRYLAIVDDAADTLVRTLHFGYITVAMCYDSVRHRVFAVGERWVTAVDAVGDSVIVARQVLTGNQMNRDVALGAHGAKLYCDIEDSLIVLDPVTLDRSGGVRIGGGFPSLMRHEPSTDRLFCTDGQNGRIHVVDCATDSVTMVLKTGLRPTALCFDLDASRAYCVNVRSDDVTVVDCIGDSVLARAAVGSRPSSLCYNQTLARLYCADSTNGFVSVIGGQTNRVEKNIWVGYGVTSLCMGPGDAKLYCRVSSESAVAAIDCATDSVVAKTRMDTVPLYLCYVPQHNRLYCGIVHGDSGTLVAIDCATDSVVTTLALQRPPRSLTYNSAEDKLYCGAGEFYDTEVISCAGDSSLGFVAGVRAQGPTLYSAGCDKLYLSCLNRLYIVDGAADTLLAAKTAVNGNVEGSMCLNTLQQKVYAPFQAGTNGSILIIDAASDSTLKTMAAESSWAVCYDSINNEVYVSDGGNFGAVKVIDCVRDVVTTRIPVGLTPHAIAWNPDQNRTYVINTWSGSISVLRDSFPEGISADAVPAARPKPMATVVHGVLLLPPASDVGRLASSVLLDISGRKVLSLHEGANDVHSLAPGVYFVRAEPSATSCQPLAVTKVVLTR
jgi:YVTN family beta-propeller protein